MSRKALLIVDVQNDFCPGGALAVPNGDKVVEPLNRIISHLAPFPTAKGWLIIASRDWHPANHCSFKEQGGPWPPHCIQHTSGAEFHPNLDIWLRPESKQTQPGIIIVNKGEDLYREEYSLFNSSTRALNNTPEQVLRTWFNVDELYIGGLTTDYCVKATALDARRLGFKTYVLTDACRAVNVKLGDEALALNEMENARVEFITTDEVIRGK